MRSATQRYGEVVAITGSTGKTSTKDILAAMCRPHARTVAAEAGHNNEIGLPLTLTRIEPDTEVVVCEMGMRGLGQIAELCALARPDVGVITSIGPVHLELLGTIENVAQAKAEVVAALPAGGAVVVPDEPLLEPYLGRDDIEIRRFGPENVEAFERVDGGSRVVFALDGQRIELEFPFTARHQAQKRRPRCSRCRRSDCRFPKAASRSSSPAGAARSRRFPAEAC